MIRDPSDGSVYEAPKAEKPNLKPAGPDSGLPAASTKPSRQERLERSREWLKDYLERKRA